MIKATIYGARLAPLHPSHEAKSGETRKMLFEELLKVLNGSTQAGELCLFRLQSAV